MAVIQYTKTYFTEPGRISEETYNEIRGILVRNPNSEVDPNPETFSQRFSGILKTIGISFLIGLFCVGVGKDNSLWVPVGAISFLTCFVFILLLLLEGPSYATYVKQKKEYFERMKYAIQNTSSYWEYATMFYK